MCLVYYVSCLQFNSDGLCWLVFLTITIDQISLCHCRSVDTYCTIHVFPSYSRSYYSGVMLSCFGNLKCNWECYIWFTVCSSNAWEFQNYISSYYKYLNGEVINWTLPISRMCWCKLSVHNLIYDQITFFTYFIYRSFSKNSASLFIRHPWSDGDIFSSNERIRHVCYLFNLVCDGCRKWVFLL